MEPVWQEAWDALQQLTGDSTFVEVFAQRPDLLEFVMRQFYGGLFFGGRVAQRYKQLARLQLSLLHGCRTCNRQNIPGALAAGFTPAQIDALIADDHTPFSAAERAVLRYARQIALTNSDGRMTPELYRELRAHFNEGELLELGTVMAVICGMAKLSFVLDLVEKEPYCPFAHAAA
ncbi:MAG: carboxymuconolactone decarboxylase family protein [Steroidobacteraceae bacterium]|nr:carboxymuconolactone decarboxylase family protein [Steroidobacteraceae bacterium]MDW8259230.1 carboxymuconolactone decarboxylase family protein [Gammaproteobacteria bacterium]